LLIRAASVMETTFFGVAPIGSSCFISFSMILFLLENNLFRKSLKSLIAKSLLK
jgi:hypothetical protein